MKRWMKIFAGVVAVMALAASASAVECVPKPPKDLEGKITLVHPARPSMASSWFEQNGCDWAGADQLNGFDGIVMDVEGMAGPASFTSIIARGSGTAFEAVFLDTSCARIGDPQVFGGSAPVAPQAYVITIPATAKWAIVQASTDLPVGDPAEEITVKIHSDGQDCAAVVKHKKKKKRRH